VSHGVAVCDRTAPAKLHYGVQGAYRWVSVTVDLFKLGPIGYRVRFLGVRFGAKYRDYVKFTSVAKRIMNDVVAWTSPQQNAVARHLKFQLLHRHYGSERCITGETWFTVADQFLAEQ